MSKILLAVAAAGGYVMGAKAGRERYDQITAQFERLRNDPRVQQKASQASDRVKPSPAKQSPSAAKPSPAKPSSATTGMSATDAPPTPSAAGIDDETDSDRPGSGR